MKITQALNVLLSFCLAAGIPLYSSGQTSSPKIGIWYSTWYANEGNYVWGNTGSNIQNQFLSDMNGDGKADAVLYSSGRWEVALSDGSKFGNKTTWTTGHGIGSSHQFLADVTGDGRKDAIVLFKSSGSLYVAVHNGTAFSSFSQWASGPGISSSNIFFGDVDGDKKEDFVLYENGSWTVSRSSGTTLATPVNWTNGHGIGSGNQFLSDVNGDSKADAVVLFPSGGAAYVALSTGTTFSNFSQWLNNSLINKTSYLLEDTDNDKKADLIGYSDQTGVWERALSTGASFATGAFWKINDGSRKRNQSKLPIQIFAGTVDKSGLPSCIAYVKETGEWRILPNDSYYRQPNILNTWQAWLINFKPIVNGVPMQYDSKNTDVIDAHLKMISEAGIHFLILDLTNNIYVDNGYIAYRAKAVAKRIKVWNSAHPNNKLFYAIAIGGVQFAGDLSSIENECRMVYEDFILDPELSGTYYYHTQKPFIACYYGSGANRTNWQWYGGSKANFAKFDFRWMNGSKDPSSPENQFPDVAYYPGWGLPATGETPNDSLMVSMPGWNNHVNSFVSRRLNDIEGDYYQKNCWDKILVAKPKTIIINSFNEYAEETSVEPCDTDGLIGSSEKWASPSMYWDMTITNIKRIAVGAGKKPYSNLALSIPGVIQAENFDHGGEGISYHDMEATNQGASYRTEGVDIEACSEGGYNVGWIKKGEWLEYTVTVLESANYNFSARLASAVNGGSLQASFDGQIAGSISITGTGGWQRWVSASTGFALSAGTHVLRITALSDNFNINELSFQKQNFSLPIESGLVYSVISKHSNKSADIAAVSISDGALLQQYSYWNQAKNQHFTFIHVADGYYQIKPLHSGKCLDVNANSTDNGAGIIQWSCHGGANQLWKVEKLEDNSFKITSKSSGKTMEVGGYSLSDGAAINQWEWTGGNNQRWLISQSTLNARTAEETGGYTVANISIYPNPAQTTITIELPSLFIGGTMTLTDNVGVNKKYEVTDNILENFSVSDLAQGVYSIQLISSGGETLHQKFIKQ